MTLILGLETSGLAGSVALLRDDELLGSRALEQAGRRHAQTLIVECTALLTEHHLTPRDLSAIAVTRGPGSFTGLRVGVVCAKTIAYALRIPLLLLDTFDVVATQCPAQWPAVWIVEDAQRQEVYAGKYVRTNSSNLQLTGDRFIQPAREWLARLNLEEIVTGPGALRLPEDVKSTDIHRAIEICVPSAETVCKLAAIRLAAGEADDYWTAAPFYIRVSGAEEKAAAKASERGA